MYSKQSYSSEMASRDDYERIENYVHASGAFSVPGQCFLPFPLRKLPETFWLKVAKSSYAHYFNTLANQDYVGKIPDISHYGVDEMNASERNEFFAWYEDQKVEVFDNRLVLES